MTAIGLDIILGNTRPSPSQTAALGALVAGAESGLESNPSAYISSVEAVISPFPFASRVRGYADAAVQGLRTVVASDLGVSAPSPTGAAATSSRSTGGVMRSIPTGVVMGAMGAVAGVVGVGLL